MRMPAKGELSKLKRLQCVSRKSLESTRTLRLTLFVTNRGEVNFPHLGATLASKLRAPRAERAPSKPPPQRRCTARVAAPSLSATVGERYNSFSEFLQFDYRSLSVCCLSIHVTVH